MFMNISVTRIQVIMFLSLVRLIGNISKSVSHELIISEYHTAVAIIFQHHRHGRVKNTVTIISIAENLLYSNLTIPCC